MSTQIIEKNGKPEFAVVPIDEYKLLLEKAEELDDMATFDRAMHDLDTGNDELIPADIAKRFIAKKDSRMKIWCEFRGIT